MDTLKGHLLSVELEACDFEHCINTSRVCCANSRPAPRGVIRHGEGTRIVKALQICRSPSGGSYFLVGNVTQVSCAFV